jgi:hypothetical protein
VLSRGSWRSSRSPPWLPSRAAPTATRPSSSCRPISCRGSSSTRSSCRPPACAHAGRACERTTAGPCRSPRSAASRRAPISRWRSRCASEGERSSRVASSAGSSATRSSASWSLAIASRSRVRRRARPTATECRDGVCVPPRDCEDRGSCVPDECSSDSECTSTIACVVPRCALGVCIETPDATRCRADEVCSPRRRLCARECT